MNTIQLIFAIGLIIFFIARTVEKSFKIEVDKNDNKKPQKNIFEKIIQKKEIRENKISSHVSENTRTKKPIKRVIEKKIENKNSNILIHINNKTEAKKAFIYSEIFKRKY